MAETASAGASQPSHPKLTGRAFYESIGSPKVIVAPMVDRSEFAWRLLTRSYLDKERSKSMLAYSPMFHARLFKDSARFRDDHFQPTKSSLASTEKSPSPPWLDGNPKFDRPLFVQFCANKPEELLEAARYVAPYCDAVDLNLGCPQGIARSGHYGAFLQEDWDTIYKLINTLHKELSIPVTAKMRILETREKTLEYAKMILSAGASILTVHGRQREQKGHKTGLADWSAIRYLRDNLPLETVLFANGNILNSGDIETCLAATGADGIMSAEGNLADPTIFSEPPKEHDPRQYWYGRDGKGGYRLDAVFRRYLDIIYKYCLEQDPPVRAPLYIPGDPKTGDDTPQPILVEEEEDEGPKRKKRKRNVQESVGPSPNLKSMQAHLFQLLRPMLAQHTDIRDTLAKTKSGEVAKFEKILSMVEAAVRKGLDQDHEPSASQPADVDADAETATALPSAGENTPENAAESTPRQKTEAIYKRPWWVCQPYIRPLPEEAIEKGSLQLSKKELKARMAAQEREAAEAEAEKKAEAETKAEAEVKAEAIEAKADHPNPIPNQRNGVDGTTDRPEHKHTSPVDVNGNVNGSEQPLGPDPTTASGELPNPKAGLVCG
ncbi:tRNA-dihydrouridine synthase 1 [Capronia epimyces CBS 606.96]|uniref:tRNA-dihydrouridine(16/17) synthase [NAD(P)(+)] n=1 Tax=Capronia epimyces CBS 606.96 TaxID=1182542 RepID=W9YTK6_9EURO|nr:tRNA-dihydrouridine synthase 1 [Capronia epimyces CBS 606.96]EXJ92591.1 tRNA-dihydrouridine synthase 1 [Capronia epimyces CBS 606.96]